MLQHLPDNPGHSAQLSLPDLHHVLSNRMAAHDAQRAHDSPAGCNERAPKKGDAKHSQNLLDSDVRVAYKYTADLQLEVW